MTAEGGVTEVALTLRSPEAPGSDPRSTTEQLSHSGQIACVFNPSRPICKMGLVVPTLQGRGDA